MAITIVQKVPNSSTPDIEAVGAAFLNSTSFTSTTGNRLIAMVTLFNNTSASSITMSDNASPASSWHSAVEQQSGGSAQVRVGIFYTDAITGRSGHVVTASGPSSSFWVMGVWEVSGIDATNPIPASGTTSVYSSGTSVATGSISPSGTGLLYVALFTTDSTGTPMSLTWSGATQEWEDTYDAIAQLAASSGSQNATWTKTGTAIYVAAIAAFQPDAGVVGYSLPGFYV